MGEKTLTGRGRNLAYYLVFVRGGKGGGKQRPEESLKSPKEQLTRKGRMSATKLLRN